MQYLPAGDDGDAGDGDLDLTTVSVFVFVLLSMLKSSSLSLTSDNITGEGFFVTGGLKNYINKCLEYCS